MKHKLIVIFSILFLTAAGLWLYAADVRITSPKGGYTSERIQKIEGIVDIPEVNRATLVINGIPQTIPVSNKKFSINIVPAPGNNLVELQAGGSNSRVSFFAKVPGRDVKVLLTWDTPTDVDLWVIDPKGDKCYYANPSIPSGGNLDTDVTTGYGPETFTMAKAMPGKYTVQVQYYASHDTPATRVKLYVIMYEGTPKEQRKEFSFVMTLPYQVYHIAEFNIDVDE